MISWRVERAGQAFSDWGYFDTFLQQAYLLPMLDVGAGEIDEYGSWSYAGGDLPRLRQIIANWLPLFESRVGQSLLVGTVTEGSGNVGVDSIVRILESLELMAEKAIANNGSINFYGD